MKNSKNFIKYYFEDPFQTINERVFIVYNGYRISINLKNFNNISEMGLDIVMNNLKNMVEDYFKDQYNASHEEDRFIIKYICKK